VDREDGRRISAKQQTLLDALRSKRVLTNHEVRAIAGARGMGRVNELINDFGHHIDVKKDSGSTWLVTYVGGPGEVQAELFSTRPTTAHAQAE